MQPSQHEESPWVEDTDASLHHAEAEWTGLSTSFTTAGYRDGISAGKEAALQEGFDAGFARTGAPRGRELGVLRGLAAALLLHLTRSSPGPGPAPKPEQEQAPARVREIVEKLAAVRFADLVSPDEEAMAHADAMCGENGSGGGVNEVQGQSPATDDDDDDDDLRTLRAQLETLLLEAGLNVPLGLD
ncbi:hypothetical protein BJY52DRAFT_1291762 [Lactarius psammicola]|nr:hypothetical protein BJY52DRAFT_1291762 [Lactarius psammicola]